MRHHWQVVDEGGITVSETPQQLWINARNYFKWMDNNPIEVKYIPKTGKLAGQEQVENKVRPYSIKSLCLHCGFDEEYLRDVRHSKKKDSEFYIVVSKILYIIYIQNYELAASDVLNPIFISKILNLDKDDTPTSSIKVIVEQAVPTLSNSENEVLEKLELEMQNAENAKEENA